ncbi:N-acetylmuramoyl-L-alanine amidase [Lysobacter hankyongensis]|uniref:N-acetylmuramoyl-L-alanine amidase n=1 Tax=Lysobacter hankyongensis TaxID=1176535 RepID=A0ABP9AHU7_9GAMM
MRVKGTTVQQIILGLALLAALCWNLAQANEIKDLQLSDGATGTRAELHLQADVAFRTLRLANPDRFVVDLPDTNAARTLQLPAPVGVIKAVRRGQPAPGTTRIVFDLATPVTPLKPRLERAADGSARLVLEWPGDGNKPVAAVPPATHAAAQQPSAPHPSAANPAVANAGAPNPTGSTPTASAPTASAPTVLAPAAVKPAATVASQSAASTIPPSAMQTPAQILAGGTAAVPAATSSSGALSGTGTATGTTAPPPAVATAEPPAPAGGKTLRDLRAGTRPLIVAIDPGHGGQDPGAIGPTGKREKDVTLAIARELARQINATPGLKAVLTRDSDMFLPLPRRTQLARQAKADIFISIHADAAENRAAKGSSVYVLSLRGASSQRARWLADKENAADLIGGAGVRKPDNTLATVLLDLTQSGQMKASEDAAGHVLSGLKSIGFNHKPNIERANFSVLRTSDMPAMLVETAFISNPDEERRLIDPAYQRTLAKAVLQGVDAYFTRQPPPGTLYAARAKAQEATVVASAAAPKVISTGGSP